MRLGLKFNRRIILILIVIIALIAVIVIINNRVNFIKLGSKNKNCNEILLIFNPQTDLLKMENIVKLVGAEIIKDWSKINDREYLSENFGQFTIKIKGPCSESKTNKAIDKLKSYSEVLEARINPLSGIKLPSSNPPNL